MFNPNWHTSAPRNVETAGMWLEELWDQDDPPGLPKESCALTRPLIGRLYREPRSNAG
jgi:hypothetical protein